LLGWDNIVSCLSLLRFRKDFRWQRYLILVFQQVESKVLQRGIWPFQVDDAHSLVQNWKHGLHQVIGVGQLLQLLPFGLSVNLLLNLLVFLISDASLNSADLLVPLSFALLDQLDEVVVFENGSMGVHFHDIHVHKFLVGNCLTSDKVSDVNDAGLSGVSVIIEENVLGVVISLVDHHQLSTIVLEPRRLVGRVVFLNGHDGVLLERLEHSSVDL